MNMQNVQLLRRKIFLITTIIFSSSLFANEQERAPQKTIAEKWNFMVYLASNNNLNKYAQPNINQMQQIGSTKFINVFVQADNYGKREVNRYYIEKGKATLLSKHSTPPFNLSGTPENLYDFVKEVIKNYPADHHALILWDHGCGIKDPNVWGRTLLSQRDEYFTFNTTSKMYEINKPLLRGIAFNDFAQTYLTNQDLRITLQKISTELLGGKKLDLLGMDACHMAMIEIGSQVKEAVSFMVGSEEIEPGRGWDYSMVLRPFETKTLTPKTFAKHIVTSYEAQYNASFADLTQSAIDLSNYAAIEYNIDAISQMLVSLLEASKDAKFATAVYRLRKDPFRTTSFVDPDYIDLAQFYKSLLVVLDNLHPTPTQKEIVDKLSAKINVGLILLDTYIIKNASGTKAKNAHGLSIYFPLRSIHTSYMYTEFAKKTAWTNFLYQYLAAKQNIRNEE